MKYLITLGLIVIVAFMVVRYWQDYQANDSKVVGLTEVVNVNQATAKAKTSLSTDTDPAKDPTPEPDTITSLDDITVDLSTDRIVAFYGNFYSTRMGILGEYPEAEVLNKLTAVSREWQAVDPTRSVIPAVHYIASTAQPHPSSSSLYTMRMPSTEIIKAIALGARAEGLTFLDLQVGWSDPLTEARLLDRYLKLPNVHLGIDPEFDMPIGVVPGTKIGTTTAAEINQVIDYLAGLVREHDLPPKVLVVHRFTEAMITNSASIKQVPEVVTIINMDGWGSPDLKFSTYKNVITNYQTPYAGFKIFYKNDLKLPSPGLVTPSQIINLTPSPVYIQYQ